VLLLQAQLDAATKQGQINELQRAAEASAKAKDEGEGKEPEKDKKRGGKRKKKEKKKSKKKRRKNDSDTSDGDSSDSSSDSSNSDSSNSGDSDDEMPTRKEIRRLFDKKVDGGEGLGSRSQAEVRFDLWALHSARRIHDHAASEDKDYKAPKALTFLMRAVTTRAKAVIEFDQSTEETATKVKRVNKKVLAVAADYDGARKIKAEGKEMLPITPMSTASMKGRKRAFGYDSDHETAPASASKRGGPCSGTGGMNKRIKELETALQAQTSEASKAPDTAEIARAAAAAVLQQQAAAGMSTRNNGFNPRGGGTGERPKGCMSAVTRVT
jgi:hypothetical protein